EGGAFKGEPKSVTDRIDRSPDGLAWAGNGKLFFVADDHGETPLFEVEITAPYLGRQWSRPGGGVNGAVTVCRDGSRMAFTNAALDHPNTLRIGSTERSARGSLRTIDPNAALLAEIDRQRPESVSIDVEGGKMQMWLLKPPGFDPNKKWPV